jgi:ribosomal protein L9
MGKETYTSESREIGKENERVDLRKHKKRITTYEEKTYVNEMRKKYQHDDLRTKMLKISKQLQEEGKIYGAR